MLLRCVHLALGALVCAVLVCGQEFRGTITGTITDPSGTGIANAKVTVQNLATNEQQTQMTSEQGNYTIPFLTPGTYKVTVEAPGFQTTVRPTVELHTNDKLSVNFEMQIGQVQSTVEVTAAPPLLDAATATRGDTIENLRVTELPINGRNPFTLTNLSTGVVFAGNPQFTRPFDNGDNINFSINGGLRQTNSWLLDGVPDDAVTDTDTQRTHGNQNIAYIPTVDATQEFKVVTNFYDAQYGRTGGGVMNVTTKSGGNDFHGTAYEFMRRYWLDANTIQNNANGRPIFARDPVTKKNIGGHKLDQYGGQFTGPVWIPKVYKGKDKTFFSFGVENYIESTPSPIQTSVPSLAERKGDFSHAGVNIYDPNSTMLNPNFNPAQKDSASNSLYIRTQFPGNIIPASRLTSPTGLAIINAYPTPNTGSPDAVTNNYIASPNVSSDHFRNWIARVDQSFGEKERMFFRYAHNRRNQIDNGANGFTGPGKDAQDPLVRLNDNAVVDSLTVLSPNTLFDFRIGYTRFIQAAYRTTVQGFDDTQLGFSPVFNGQRFNALPPRIIDSTGLYPTFGTRNPSQNTTNILSFEPSLTWIHGRQSFKFGSDVRDIRTEANGGSFIYGAGEWTFSPAFTQQFPEFSSSTSGASLASLILGAPSSGIMSYTPPLAYRWGYYGFYIQDDIKLTQKLTINAGIRYDIEGSPSERYNRMNRGWNFNQPSPLAPFVANADPANCPACANLTGGLLFAGNNGLPRNAFNFRYGDVQPRIGAAYALTPLTVIRGGFGVFYLPESEYGGSLGFAADTNYVASLTGGGINNFLPSSNFASGNPFPAGIVQPSGNLLGTGTALGSGVIFSNPNRKIPHVYQYSFGIERQLPWDTKLDVEYVGSRSYNINIGDNQAGAARNINFNTVGQIQQAFADPSYFNEAVPNPFAGLIPNNPALNGATISRQQLLLPYPQFTSVQEAFQSVGKLWYDSLQVNAVKRYSSHLVLAVAYTFSKNLDATSFVNPQDPKPTRMLASSDRPHRFVVSGVYQLPFGKGRKFASNINRAEELLIGGWEYNFIGTLQSGTPFSNPTNVNQIADPTISGSTYSNYFNSCVLQPDGTSKQPNASRTAFVPCSNPAWQLRSSTSLTLQTIPFNSFYIRNPWRAQWDMSLNKNFNFTERVNFQFRLEAFNVFNTPILGAPNNSATSLNFGFVAPNQSNFPRDVQLGFKLNF